MTTQPPDPTIKPENLFNDLPTAGHEEHLQPLFERPGVRLERIISWGHTTPPGEWYDQKQDEWVMVVRGAARLLVERRTGSAPGASGESGEPVEQDVYDLREGDTVFLPAHCRHRVEWTSLQQPTIWLALHYWANPDEQD